MRRRRSQLLGGLLTSALVATSTPALAAEMHGFLRSRSSEAVGPRDGDDWSFQILMLAPEGSRVNVGDPVARFEGDNIKRFEQRTNAEYLTEKVEGAMKLSQIREELRGIEEQLQQERKQLGLLQVGQNAKGAYLDWVRTSRDRLIEQSDFEARTLRVRLLEEKVARRRTHLQATEAAVTKSIASKQLRLERLQQQLNTAPMAARSSGTVVYRKAPWDNAKPRVGATAWKGQTLLEIVDDRDLLVEAFLLERDLKSCQVGQRVQVELVGQGDRAVAGTVRSISPVVLTVGDWDRNLPEDHYLARLRSFQVKIDLDSVPEEARPDREVRVVLDGKARTDAD